MACQRQRRESHVIESLGISDAIVVAIEGSVDQERGQPVPSEQVGTCTGRTKNFSPEVDIR